MRRDFGSDQSCFKSVLSFSLIPAGFGGHFGCRFWRYFAGRVSPVLADRFSTTLASFVYHVVSFLVYVWNRFRSFFLCSGDYLLAWELIFRYCSESFSYAIGRNLGKSTFTCMGAQFQRDSSHCAIFYYFHKYFERKSVCLFSFSISHSF